MAALFVDGVHYNLQAPTTSHSLKHISVMHLIFGTLDGDDIANR